MIDLTLKIDKTDSPLLWGQVNVNDNLIIEKADTELKLCAKIKALLLQWEGLDQNHYTLTKEYI